MVERGRERHTKRISEREGERAKERMRERAKERMVERETCEGDGLSTLHSRCDEAPVSRYHGDSLALQPAHGV